jgi:hypothetical protein
MTQEAGPRPSWIRAVGFALAAGPYVGAGREAARTLVLRKPWDWGDVLLYVGVWTLSIALFAGLVAALRRRRGDRDGDRTRGRAMVEQALATGALPDRRDASAWRRALAAEARESRQRRWALWVIGLVIAALVAAAAVDSADVVVGALALVLAVVLVVPDRRLARRAARAEDLLARL